MDKDMKMNGREKTDHAAHPARTKTGSQGRGKVGNRTATGNKNKSDSGSDSKSGKKTDKKTIHLDEKKIDPLKDTEAIKRAIRERHAVRQYLETAIPDDVVNRLQEEIVLCNQESGLHLQLITNDPETFGGMLAHYGKFTGVRNYIVLVGKKGKELARTAGYYGERIALAAQILGLNTCWVALTFSKRKCRAIIQKDEKMICVLSVGYGVTRGVPHKSKEMHQLCHAEGEIPDWFRAGMELALLAPTTTNQQKFMVSLEQEQIILKATGGILADIDLGIVKYHLEIGSGKAVIMQ